MAKIPAFDDLKGLPVSFEVLTAVPLTEKAKKNLFFYTDFYQGMALAEPFNKPISKSIDWSVFKQTED